MPTWLGDTVMATPTLRALRQLYPDAHITALLKHNLYPILDACPYVDRIRTIRSKREGKKLKDAKRSNSLRMANLIKKGNFDTTVLLPNSFRWALIAALAKVPRRVGYDRDGRGTLLTDRLLPRRSGGGFVPVCTRDYYMGIARYLGAAELDPKMQLHTRPEHDQAATDLLKRGGVDPDSNRPFVILNPGANYGDAKMWYPERFAEAGDRIAKETGAIVAVSGAPKERQILDQVVAAAKQPILNLPKLGADLYTLKSLIKRCDLMVTNDTGPRHIAVAFDRPVVTVFGPTDPAWTDLGSQLEKWVRVDVFCGPCQKKKCPLDHRCMTRIDADMVAQPSISMLQSQANEDSIQPEQGA